jgi:nucleotide-binding universal stress UspA family protein
VKVLLATDGSGGAALAEGLVGSLRWPEGTEIVVLRMALPIFAGGDLPADAYTALHEKRQRDANEHLAKIGAELGREGLVVSTRVRLGRSASGIVEEARRLEADLIVLGSRGLGPFKSAVLGSVAAEVVDHSPCPVLVARASEVRGVVVGADGSSEAAIAQAIVSEWPVFHGLPVHVVAVAAIPPVVSGNLGPHIAASADEAWAVETIRAGAQRIADEAAEHLRAAGARVDTAVRGGDPAHQLIEAATEAGADLIVTGSRGATGLGRLLLGSVARGVLQHAPCSVMIVRGAAEIVRHRGDGARSRSASPVR